MESNGVPVELLVRQVAWLLVAATVIGMLAHWARIPYEIALVLVGLLIEESHVVAVPHLQPELVLLVFLPPLPFDAAFRVGTLLEHARPVLLAIVAVTLAWLVVVWVPPLIVPSRFRVTGVGDRAVLTWGGLRGALTIALALALPAETPSRELLVAMAFGVTLFTLVVQGLTLP